MQTGENIGEDMDGVCRRPTEQTGMQIAVGRGDDDFLADRAAKGCGNGGCIPVPHAGIADQRIIGLQFFRIGFEERFQRRRAGFFFAFKENGDPHRQAALDSLVRPAGFHEGHQLALVVCRAASGNHLSASADILDGGFERIVFPKLERIDRLYVIMAVEKHMRRVLGGRIVMRHDHGVAGGIAHGGRKAERRKRSDQPFRRLAAFRLVAGSVEIDGMRTSSNSRSRLEVRLSSAVERMGKRLSSLILSCLS